MCWGTTACQNLNSCTWKYYIAEPYLKIPPFVGRGFANGGFSMFDDQTVQKVSAQLTLSESPVPDLCAVLPDGTTSILVAHISSGLTNRMSKLTEEVRSFWDFSSKNMVQNQGEMKATSHGKSPDLFLELRLFSSVSCFVVQLVNTFFRSLFKSMKKMKMMKSQHFSPFVTSKLGTSLC